MKMTQKYDVIISKKLDSTIGINILEGTFKDVLLSINSLKSEELNDETVVEFYVIHKPKHISDENLNSKEFQDLFESIIKDLFEGAQVDSSRNEDTETFDL